MSNAYVLLLLFWKQRCVYVHVYEKHTHASFFCAMRLWVRVFGPPGRDDQEHLASPPLQSGLHQTGIPALLSHLCGVEPQPGAWTCWQYSRNADMLPLRRPLVKNRNLLHSASVFFGFGFF